MTSRPGRPVASGVTLGAAVGVFGVSFGVLSTSSGLSVAQTCVMSLLVFTGASQFALVSISVAGGSTWTALGSALLLAARNLAYGLSLAPTVRGRLGRRLLASHLVIDESTAMAAAQPDQGRAEQAFWATGLAIFVFWNAGTLIGALGGQAVGDPATLGLDAAFPAGFLVLMAPHLRRPGGRSAALIGGLIALVLIPITPAGTPILAAAAGALVGLRRDRRGAAGSSTPEGGEQQV